MEPKDAEAEGGGESKPEWLSGVSTNLSYGDEDFSSPNIESGSSSQPPFLQRAQSVAIIISLLLSPVAVILVAMWANDLGGVSWEEGESKQVFNWHPVLMICAYAFMNVGSLIFRVTATSGYHASMRSEQDASPHSPTTYINQKKRGIVKLSHASIWSLSIIFGIVAMLAVFKSHNDPVNGYIANLYSFHSWVGVLVLSIYTLQFLVGVMAFGGLLSNNRVRSPLVLEIHKYTGTYLHMLVTATIMLGIMEKEGFVGCGYDVEEADLMPFKNFGKIPGVCKISHFLGLTVLAMGIFTSFGLARFPVLK